MQGPLKDISNPDLQYPPHHAKTFTSFASPIDLRMQSSTAIGGGNQELPFTAASGILLTETAGAAECVFSLGIGKNFPVQITVRRGTSIFVRGAWTSIQSAVGGTPEAVVFWQI